jgi:hypothetical protein
MRSSYPARPTVPVRLRARVQPAGAAFDRRHGRAPAIALECGAAQAEPVPHTFTGNGWWNADSDPGFGWIDHYWAYPTARFDGMPTSTTPTGVQGNTYAMFWHAEAYRMNQPDIRYLQSSTGQSLDWARDFESYLSTSQRRYAPDYPNFGSISDRWNA